MANERLDNLTSGVWSERVLIITNDYEIKGDVFMPKVGKRNRLISDILNSTKSFIAVKNCTLKHRHILERETEEYEFLQLNLNSVILMRPITRDIK